MDTIETAALVLALLASIGLVAGGLVHASANWWKCAYCKRYFDDLGNKTNRRHFVDSHGSCQECGIRLMEEINKR